MTWTINSAPLLRPYKFCASFCSCMWIQIGVTVRIHSNPVKIVDFLACVTLNLMDDLEKQGTSSLPLRAFCIISYPSVNSNWSYSPEMPKLGQNLLWPWPLTFTFCRNIISVSGNYFWKFHNDTIWGTLWKRCDWQRGRQTEPFLELLGHS